MPSADSSALALWTLARETRRHVTVALVRQLAELNGKVHAEGPTKGYGLIKKAMHASYGNSLDAQLDLERDLQREAGFSEDYRKGVAEFLKKK